MSSEPSPPSKIIDPEDIADIAIEEALAAYELTPSPFPFEIKSPEDDPVYTIAALGEIIDLNGATFTINQLTFKAELSENTLPDGESIFLIMNCTVKNTSEAYLWITSLPLFELQDDDLSPCEQLLDADYAPLNETLSPDESISGHLIFVVPKSTENFFLEFDPQWTGDYKTLSFSKTLG